MYFPNDCQLVPTDTDPTRGTCPACDLDGERPLPLGTHRQCGKPRTLREQVEADLADDPLCTRPPEAISATLDRCFGGCPYFSGQQCVRHPRPDERYERWLERVGSEGCDITPPVAEHVDGRDLA